MPLNLDAIRNGFGNEHVIAAKSIGLRLSPSLDRATWTKLVGQLAHASRHTAENSDTLTAWLGDLLAYGDGKYRGQIAEIARAAGLHPTTLRNAKLVCIRIPLSRRRDNLSWSHHSEVGKAFADPEAIDYWLQIAETGKLSRSQLRQRIQAARKTPDSSTCTAEQAAPFALLRELRAIDRLLRRDKPGWQSWSPTVCQRALGEVAALDSFLAELRQRASCVGEASPHLTHSPSVTLHR